MLLIDSKFMGKIEEVLVIRFFFSLTLIAQCLENIQSESETKCEIMFIC